MSVTDKLRWRYATKKFNADKKIPNDKLDLILEAVHLAPSSYGLQHFRILVITNIEIRKKLAAAAWNQPQLLTASHVIVFAAETKLDRDYVDANLDNIAKTRNVDRRTLEGWEEMIIQGIQSRSNGNVLVNWSQKQAYIGLGIAISIAAELGIDSCPMEGFDVDEFNKILDLEQMNLTATVMLPIGYRASDDEYAQFAKVRRPKNEFSLFIE